MCYIYIFTTIKTTKNIIQVREEEWGRDGGKEGREKEQQPQLELYPVTSGSQTSFSFRTFSSNILHKSPTTKETRLVPQAIPEAHHHLCPNLPHNEPWGTSRQPKEQTTGAGNGRKLKGFSLNMTQWNFWNSKVGLVFRIKWIISTLPPTSHTPLGKLLICCQRD